MIERRLFDYAHLATYLGIGITKAKEIVGNGEIPKTRIAGRVLFDRADVDAYIERIKRSA